MTIASTETLLAAIAGLQTDQAITLPTHARLDAAGGEAAFVQFLITWAQQQRTASIKTYAQGSSDEQIDRITRQLFGLVASLLCDRAADRTGKPIFDEVRKLANARLNILQGPNPRAVSRGPQFEVVCADHLQRRHPNVLYEQVNDGKHVVSDLPAYFELAKKILDAVIPSTTYLAASNALVEGIGGALYELIRNTDEHANRDDSGGSLKRSIRGLQAKRHAMNPASRDDVTVGTPALAAYCSKLRPPRERNRDIQLIELSVFDSGPGFASSWTKRPLEEISEKDELAAIIACFEKHATRKVQSSAGLGLSNVIDILRERNGFLRLRTGRHSLYANLADESDAEYGIPPKLSPVREDNRRHSRVAGTLLTLLFPLEAIP